MRNRTIGINVRVSENEKKKLQKNAQKANLKLSSYLRKVGLQQKIYEIPDEELRKIYAGIVELKNEFPYMSNEEIKEKIAKMQSDFLDIYNYKIDVETMADISRIEYVRIVDYGLSAESESLNDFLENENNAQ